MRYFKKSAVLMVGISVVVGIFIGFLFQPLISGDNIFSEIKKFNYVLNTAYKNYVDDVDSHKLVESAIKGMLSELDPHSVYIPAEDMKDVREDFEGAFEGIGVEFDVIHDTITIISPIPGGPSESLGIQSGDKIVEIDGENAIGINRNDVPKKLKGPKGTHVKVGIFRHGAKGILNFDIARDKIPIFTVDASFLIDGTDIGVVVVNRFAATTHEETVEALRKLKRLGMKKVILDLRGNPGGYLSQAVFLADEFLKAGDTIVYTRGRLDEFDEAFISTDGGEFENIPLIALINAGSASASEIVSGAIQDLDRGLIIGSPSYGKGLVQRQYDVDDGSSFRITTSKYYTPSGRCIQRPYKDKDKYRHLEGRLELAEGDYINNSIDKIKEHLEKNGMKNEKINVDSLPIYFTKNGRIVMGAGGITPDLIVKNEDTLTPLGVSIRMKVVFNEFINDFVDVKSVKNKYGDDFNSFLRDYQVPQKVLDDFKSAAIKAGVEWKDDDYKVDKDYFVISLKAYIAKSVWNRNEMLQVFYTLDNQIKAASTSFKEIARLSEARQPKKK